MPGDLYIFDLDGTLIDSAADIVSAANKSRVFFGFTDAEANFYHQRIGLPADLLFQDLSLDPIFTSQLVGKFREFLELGFREEIKIFPGVIEFLRAAKLRNIAIAIATNKPECLARKLVSQSLLNDYIDLTVGTGGHPAKPKPDMLEFCLEYFGVEGAIMFGDRSEDMIAAHLSGIKGVGISQSVHSKQDLEDSGASLSFSNFQELHTFFVQSDWRSRDV